MDKRYNTEWESLQDGISYGHGLVMSCTGYLTDNSFKSICKINKPAMSIYEDAILFNGDAGHISIPKNTFIKWRNFQTDKEDCFDIHTTYLKFMVVKTLDK
jgi:hypothetical protein